MRTLGKGGARVTTRVEEKRQGAQNVLENTKTPTLQKQRGCSISHIRGSARTLVVGDALRLRRAGLLGGEGQHDERNDIREHVVYRAGDIERG